MSTASRPYGSSKPISKAFVVIVAGTLPEDKLKQMIELFKPLAAHVATNEEGCFAYELSLGAEPGTFVIYERYVSKEYLEQIHCQSEPFKAFVAATTDIGIDLMGFVKTFHETDIGFA